MTEHFSEPGGHEVVEDGVNGRAQVEADSRDDVEVPVDRVVLLERVSVVPHQAVQVKGSPTKAEHDHQHTWRGEKDSLGK